SLHSPSCYDCYRDLRDPHSVPTRRSSDLVCQLPSGAESKNRICLRSVRICAVRARPVVPCRQFWLFAVLYALNHRQAPLVPPSRSPLVGPSRVSQLHTTATAPER